MILYNASTSLGLRNIARSITNTNSTSYSDADLDVAINTYYDLFATEILASMDEWDFQGEIATTDLVANQQEYVFPSDILKIKRIEITYDGTNWYTASPMDINERGYPTDTTTLSGDFTASDPFYDLMDNSIMLYPIPTTAITAGLKIWYEKNVTQLSSVTDEPNIPRPFQKGLCYGAAKDYFEKYLEKEGNQAKLITASNNLELYISRMKAFFRKRNQDRPYNVETAYVDYDYGNE